MLIDQINKYSQQLEFLLNILGGEGSRMEIEGIINHFILVFKRSLSLTQDVGWMG